MQIDKQKLADQINVSGIRVKGRDGSIVKGKVYGVRREFATVIVFTPFGEVTAEFAWKTLDDCFTNGRTLQL